MRLMFQGLQISTEHRKEAFRRLRGYPFGYGAYSRNLRESLFAALSIILGYGDMYSYHALTDLRYSFAYVRFGQMP